MYMLLRYTLCSNIDVQIFFVDELSPDGSLAENDSMGEEVHDDGLMEGDLVVNPPPDAVPNSEEDQVQGRGRKRIINENSWVRNSRKRMRNTGKEYEYRVKCDQTYVKKKRPAKQMGPGCGVTCRNHCKARITNEQRAIIFQNYYAMGDSNRQREYISRHTTEKTPYARKENAMKVRKRSNHYYFTIKRLMYVKHIFCTPCPFHPDL